MPPIEKKAIWLDCDPGHDDVTALLLAIHIPEVNLLGVSTVHGNSTPESTFINAARCLYAFAASEDICVYSGASRPLLRPPRHDPEIHGLDGLGGVEGLPNSDNDNVKRKFGRAGTIAVDQMANTIRDYWDYGNGDKVTIVASGPMTNLALFASTYTDLIPGVKEIVFMGGGVGIGNRSAVAGNVAIQNTAEAAQMVLDIPVKKTMLPLNVTHTAIVTDEIFRELRSPGSIGNPNGNADPLKASTHLRHMLCSIIAYFASAYKSIFGFNDGPPLHDALTIAYVAYPEMFKVNRYRVDVELTGTHTTGETVVDLYNYRSCDESWGVNGKNCLVAEAVDVASFFKVFLEAVRRCDEVSPLNK